MSKSKDPATTPPSAKPGQPAPLAAEELDAVAAAGSPTLMEASADGTHEAAHTGGANFAMADGSVRLAKTSIKG